MARPGSRGGAGFSGDWGAGAGAGGRPGTGARLGTGRLGTGAMEPGYAGVGLSTEVQVADRPVTQQGMMGMRPASAGPGRQVQDGSYFLGLLRSKITSLTEELTRLKGNIEQFHKDNSTYASLERQYETLITNVRSLEGELADYNLAMDKSRTSTDPAAITQYFHALKRRNESDAADIDAIFMQRNEKERQLEDLEREIHEIQRRAAAKMDSLPEHAREEYARVSEENLRMTADISQMQAQLENTNARIADAEEELSRDTWRDEGARLESQISRLRSQLEELKEESRTAKMDPAEMRDRLYKKVKEDNDRLLELTNRRKAIEEDNEAKRTTIAELDADLEERKGEGGGDSHKYEVLYQRDREMTEFIEAFPDSHRKALEDRKRTQDTIVALLEHISTELERQQHLPSAQQVEGMRSETAAKGTELENAQTTHERLQGELMKRQQELEKIKTLDEKINVELKSLGEKMATMKREMVTFANIEELKRRAEEVAASLDEQRSAYTMRRDMLRGQVHQLSLKYERAKARLEGSDTSQGMEALESKLRHYEQSIFSMREYVETKGRETEYVPVRDDVVKASDELNALVVRAVASYIPPMTTGTPY